MTDKSPETPAAAQPNELLPINLKAIAWLKKHFVEFHEPGINACKKPLHPAIKEKLEGATTFLEFVATVQMHEVLAKKVKELSIDYWYSTEYDQEAGETVTVGSLKRLLVNLDADHGECWRMLGFHLTDQEAEDVIRLMEKFDANTHLEDDMALNNITL
ncbi:hypothetical protein KC19_5G070400 [Ceratodon purpureus]|uniref:Uncharacterized protein n=1 Tax=Ceratodon purpureus TaxID=3225 RepID=A0A8T0I071_CERPU|nr:hypothetical protein KC19_5G070400 [Ceratodon purpureus]